jgi:subtilisin family serine protease
MQDAVSRHSRACGTAPALAALGVAFACLAGPAAHAQNFVRPPTINIGPRAPTINPNVVRGGDIGPRIATPTPHIVTPRIVNPNLPYVHYSPNLYPSCGAAFRDSDGECLSSPVTTTAGGDGGSSGKGKSKGNSGSGRNTNTTQNALNLRAYNNHIVAELDGALTDEQADALARRHGLRRIGSQSFALIGATIGLFQIIDGRSYDTVSREFAAAAGVVSVQKDFRYFTQDQKAGQAEGDAAQYALVKLRLPEAHTLAHGNNVLVAVIDSGIDISHPELAGSVTESFDALGSSEGPHAHGTGIAGAIASHARLMGAAPAVHLLAIRAFGQGSAGEESSSFAILKALDRAVTLHAQIINMSFAGPKDALIERAINAVAARNILMVAASGNAGAKSPPLFPAANPHVIAVSATDAKDRLFEASNRGSYIAIAAPGAEILLPAPDQKYQITSGTSFSAAFVSGVAALVLERNPALKPDEVRAILTRTARDLGSPGRDDLFGAGEADAYAAVQASVVPAAPVVASDSAKDGEKAAQTAVDRSPPPPVAAAIEAVRPTAQ